MTSTADRLYQRRLDMIGKALEPIARDAADPTTNAEMLCDDLIETCRRWMEVDPLPDVPEAGELERAERETSRRINAAWTASKHAVLSATTLKDVSKACQAVNDALDDYKAECEPDIKQDAITNERKTTLKKASKVSSKHCGLNPDWRNAKHV